MPNHLTENFNTRRVAAISVFDLLTQNHEDHCFLAKNNMTVVPHSTYSPDLAPCDFFLFPKIKIALKERRFNDVEKIQADSQAMLDAVRKEEFRKCL